MQLRVVLSGLAATLAMAGGLAVPASADVCPTGQPHSVYEECSDLEATATDLQIEHRALPDVYMNDPKVLTPAGVLDASKGFTYIANGAPRYCNMQLSASFGGFRNTATGVVNGDWFYRTAIDCSGPQPKLTSYAGLHYRNGEVSRTTPQKCDACSSTQSSGGWICSFCNGDWYARGYFWLYLDPTWLVTGVPKDCTYQTGNSFYCVLTTNKMYL